MTAPKQVDFVDGVTVVAADFLDRIQEIEAGLAINMALAISGTALVLNAGSGNLVSSITIDEKFRYLETPQNLSFTGSDAAGSYGIFATTTATDSNPSFALEKVAGTGTPSSAAHYRKIATVSWDGSTTLSSLVQIAGYDKHGHMHTLTTDPLPAASVSSSQIVDGTIVLADLATSLQNYLVPVGSVFSYAGSSAPSQYLLCDGSEVSETTYAALFAALGTQFNNGSETSGYFRIPDLRGRVVAGIDNMGGSAASRLTSGGSGVTGTTRGAVGGAETHTLNSSQSGMPGHTVNADGGHTHAVSTNGNHSHGGGTTGAGGHDHQFASVAAGVAAGTNVLVASFNGVGGPVNYRTSGIGDHAHGIYADGNHIHTVNGGSHIHGVNAANASSAHQNTQPTMVLNYIIRY